MAIVGSRLLAYAAKIAVDRVTGSHERTEEGLRILREEWAALSQDSGGEKSDIVQAKYAANDEGALDDAVSQAVAEAGQEITLAQKEAIEFSLATAFANLPPDTKNTQAAADVLAQDIMPGQRRSYVIWTNAPEVFGPDSNGRYVHFSYDGASYRVRDFIGGQMFYPSGSKATDKNLKVAELPFGTLKVWALSRGQIRCSGDYGLNFPVSETDKWRQMLLLLTEVAAHSVAR